MEHVRKLYQLSGFEGSQLKYEVYTQPLHNWLWARFASAVAMSTVKPGIEQAVAVYEFVEDKLHSKRCNNDCGDVVVYTIPGDFDSGVKRKGCVFMPLDMRLDCWAYETDRKNSTTVRAI